MTDTVKRDNNLVAVITNGTAMLGLGNIGLLARKSVMPRLSSAITALQRPVPSTRPPDRPACQCRGFVLTPVCGIS
jgi:Malic enzyme, N-terminal domain